MPSSPAQKSSKTSLVIEALLWLGIMLGILLFPLGRHLYGEHFPGPVPVATGTWSDRSAMVSMFARPTLQGGSDVACMPHGKNPDSGWTCHVSSMFFSNPSIRVEVSTPPMSGSEALYQAGLAFHWSDTGQATGPHLDVRVSPTAATFEQTSQTIDQVLVRAQSLAYQALAHQDAAQQKALEEALARQTPEQRAAYNAKTWSQ